jgi:alpha-galactosidase
VTSVFRAAGPGVQIRHTVRNGADDDVVLLSVSSGLPDVSPAFHGRHPRGNFAVTSHGSFSSGEVLPTGVLATEDGPSIVWQVETSAGWHWEVTQTEGTVTVGVHGRTDLWIRELRPVDARLPVVYNDFMNTLMAGPSTEKELPLIEAASEAGAEYYCVDDGWFGDGNWWTSAGDWHEAPGHFQLDFRHPAARAHLDETVDRLVAELGIEFFKLDYNVNSGVGTDVDAEDPGAGLLGHTRAFRDSLSRRPNQDSKESTCHITFSPLARRAAVTRRAASIRRSAWRSQPPGSPTRSCSATARSAQRSTDDPASRRST